MPACLNGGRSCSVVVMMVLPLPICIGVPFVSLLLPATLDGGLGFLLPVQERVFRRLNMLQAKMVPALSHSAGLNPRAFRWAV